MCERDILILVDLRSKDEIRLLEHVIVYLLFDSER
jgi:hypothetical protein